MRIVFLKLVKVFRDSFFFLLIEFTEIMANRNDSTDSKAKKSSSCGSLMPNWNHNMYFFKCRETTEDNLCILKGLFAMCIFIGRTEELTYCKIV